ncbi:MAG: hypothetical protein OXB84_07940 [Halobacteriovoraceae bacterium]|nr:hypothetical protein [Halobacteriovoraceae bacterium]
MKKLSIFVFTCLLLGNAFGSGDPEDSGLTPDEIAAIEQNLTEKLCPLHNLPEEYRYIRVLTEEYSCSSNIEDLSHPAVFECYNYGSGTDHTISCSRESETETKTESETETETKAENDTKAETDANEQ